MTENMIDCLANEDVLTLTNHFSKDSSIFSVIELLIQYCKTKKNHEKDISLIMNNLNQIATFTTDFDLCTVYASRYLDEMKALNDEEGIADALVFCANAYSSSAMTIASNICEDIDINSEQEIYKDIPEELKKKAEDLITSSVEFSHQAYIGHLKLAILRAEALGIVKDDLSAELDDEHLVNTITTLIESLNNLKERPDELNYIYEHLQYAQEMNEKCMDFDGISLEELIVKVRNMINSDECDCDSSCECRHGSEEEEEEEEEDAETLKREGDAQLEEQNNKRQKQYSVF